MAVNFTYFFKESASSMRRNMALTAAAVLVTSLSLLILGVVGMSVHAGNGLATSMKERVDEIRVFLNEGVTVEERASMENFIRNMTEVKSVKYISKEDALKEFEAMYADEKDLLQEIEGNPLPAEFKVRMKDPKWNNTVAGRISTRPEVSVDSAGKKEIKNPRDVVQKAIKITGAIQKFGLVVVLAFGLVAVALVSITIRMAIYSRRKEIGIMKLVGATNWFIRWPFIMEGVMEGFFGALVGIIVAILVHSWFISKLEAAAENVRLVGGSYMVLLSVVLIVIGIVIGAVGSAFALRRYIEV
jgi:cell division transport system permease protein